jgi:tetratricopeptide (TPR) repeat protein
MVPGPNTTTRSPELPFDSLTIEKRLPLIVLNLLNEAAQVQPILLLFEDLQWAGEGIELLKLVATSISQSKVLVVANYRSDESPHLPETLSSMKLMNLPRLSESSIRQLSEAMLGEIGRQDNVLELIQRETEGNAFFIVEVVRALAEEAGTLGDVGRSTLPAQVFAGGIKKIIERRLDKLPAWAFPATQLAAIIGREIKADLMQQIMPKLKLDNWLNINAEAAIFITSGESWQFAHDKLREYLLENMPSAERRLIHRQVAEAIESLYSDKLHDYYVLLVQHFGAAGDDKKEGHYAVLAAESLIQFNPRDARKYIKRALALNAHEHAENSQKQLAYMYLLLSKSLIRLNEYDEAKENLSISQTISESLGDTVAVAICKHHIGEIGFLTGKFTEALPILHEALEVLLQTEDWRNIGYCYMNIGVIYGRQRETVTARGYFEKCLEAMEKSGDGIMIAQALNNLGINYDTEGEWDKAVELYNRSLALRRELKDKRGIAYSLANLGALAFDQERYEDAKVLRLEALKLVREIGDRGAEANMLDALGNSENVAGNYEKALNYFQEALPIAQKTGIAYLEPMIWIHIGETQENLGMDSKESFDAALRVANKRDIIPNKREAVFHLAIWHSKKGDQALAVESLAVLSQSHPDYKGKKLSDELEKLKAAMDTGAYEAAFARGEESLENLITKLLDEESHG